MGLEDIKIEFHPDAEYMMIEPRSGGNLIPDREVPEGMWFCTKAEEIIYRGHNVLLKSGSHFPNYAYQQTWNELAEEHGLWVKFDWELRDDDSNYEVITVGLLH